jgi:hypothetical protein
MKEYLQKVFLFSLRISPEFKGNEKPNVSEAVWYQVKRMFSHIAMWSLTLAAHWSLLEDLARQNTSDLVMQSLVWVQESPHLHKAGVSDVVNLLPVF